MNTYILLIHLRYKKAKIVFNLQSLFFADSVKRLVVLCSVYILGVPVSNVDDLFSLVLSHYRYI